MAIYQADHDSLPDSEFESGQYEHLVVGNCGRLLDARRTPISIVELRPPVGIFIVRIEAFEDKNALWEVPFEAVSEYQFEKAGQRANAHVLLEIQEAVKCFNHPLYIPCNPEVRNATLKRLEKIRVEVSEWLDRSSEFFAEL